MWIKTEKKFLRILKNLITLQKPVMGIWLLTHKLLLSEWMQETSWKLLSLQPKMMKKIQDQWLNLWIQSAVKQLKILEESHRMYSKFKKPQIRRQEQTLQQKWLRNLNQSKKKKKQVKELHQRLLGFKILINLKKFSRNQVVNSKRVLSKLLQN